MLEYRFTEYLDAMGHDGEPADPASFQELWRALRKALTKELQRKGMWHRSPRFFGVIGWQHWFDEPQSGPSSQIGPLDELAADCYSYNFIDRLRSLRRHLEVKANVDGLVVRNIRNFLHERQRRQDPLGFRVFQIAQMAARQAVAGRRLRIFSGDPRIGSDTLFSTAGNDSGPGKAPEEEIRSWAGALLPELISARGTEAEEVTARLAGLMSELALRGSTPFRLGVVVDVLKKETRESWAALGAESVSGPSSSEWDRELDIRVLVGHIDPDTRVEELDSFFKLAGCVGDGIEALGVQNRTRRHLSRLWQFLRAHACDAEQLSGNDDRLPSRRKLAKLLGIPRERFNDLYETLGQLVIGCRPANSPHADVITRRGAAEAALREEGAESR